MSFFSVMGPTNSLSPSSLPIYYYSGLSISQKRKEKKKSNFPHPTAPPPATATATSHSHRHHQKCEENIGKVTDNEMVGLGLSVVLEAQSQMGGTGKSTSIESTGVNFCVGTNNNDNRRPPQVISKISMIKSSPTSPSPSPSPSWKSVSSPTSTNTCGFLDHCFLCKQKLLPGKDIFMYKGDRPFCSVECRCRQIFMDEEEILKREKNNCSLAALKPQASSSSSSSSPSGNGDVARNRASNWFAY